MWGVVRQRVMTKTLISHFWYAAQLCVPMVSDTYCVSVVGDGSLTVEGRCSRHVQLCTFRHKCPIITKVSHEILGSTISREILWSTILRKNFRSVISGKVVSPCFGKVCSVYDSHSLPYF